MNNIKLDDIAERIIDAVLSEPHINKESLRLIIRPILKIWIKQTDTFKSQKAKKPKLQQAIESREIEKKYWKTEIQKLVSNEEMQKHYEKISELFIEAGFIRNNK